MAGRLVVMFLCYVAAERYWLCVVAGAWVVCFIIIPYARDFNKCTCIY